jgi:hypothetical protein
MASLFHIFHFSWFFGRFLGGYDLEGLRVNVGLLSYGTTTVVVADRDAEQLDFCVMYRIGQW